jgi:hypothetical protein
MIRDEKPFTDQTVSKKKYLELLAKYRRAQAHIAKLTREKEELRWKMALNYSS